MDVYIGLNYEWFHLTTVKYYTPVLLINVKEKQLQCLRTNSITILMENPRTNIELISAVFYFYFHDWPQSQNLGQVISKCTIFNCIDDKKNTEQYPCILFLKGSVLEEILIYLPTRPTSFLREIKYKKNYHQREDGMCVICLDENTTVINVHENNEFNHELCMKCILQLKQFLCPLCRIPIV